MFFPSKYRNRGAKSGKGKNKGSEYVLETNTAALQHMATVAVKFDLKSPAAQKLQAAVFEKIKEIWDSTLQDDAVAQYAVALASRGSDRKKLETSLGSMLGENTAKDLCEWLMKYIRLHRDELAQTKEASKKAVKSSDPSAQQKSGSVKHKAQAPPAVSSAASEEHPLLQDEEQLPDDDLLEEETAVGEQALAAAQAEAAGFHELQKEAAQDSNLAVGKEAGSKKPRPNQSESVDRNEDRRTGKYVEDTKASNRGLDRHDSSERRHDRDRDREQDGCRVEQREERTNRTTVREEERPRDRVREWDRGKRWRDDIEHEDRRGGSHGSGKMERGGQGAGSHQGDRERLHSDEFQRHSTHGRSGSRYEKHDAGLRVEVGEGSTAQANAEDPVSPSPRTRLRSAVVVAEDVAKITKGSSLLFRNALMGSVGLTGSDVGRGAKPKAGDDSGSIRGSIQRKRGAAAELKEETALDREAEQTSREAPKRGSIFDRIQPAAAAACSEEQVVAPSRAPLVVGMNADKGPLVVGMNADKGPGCLPVLARLGTGASKRSAPLNDEGPPYEDALRPSAPKQPCLISEGKGKGPGSRLDPAAVSLAQPPEAEQSAVAASSAAVTRGAGLGLKSAAGRGLGPGPRSAAGRSTGPGPRAAVSKPLSVAATVYTPGPTVKPAAAPAAACVSTDSLVVEGAAKNPIKPSVEEVKPRSNSLDPAKRLQEMAAEIERLEAQIRAASRRTVVMERLPLGATEEHIRTFFRLCGKPQAITLLKDSTTGKPVGSAHVEFDNEKSVHSAVELNGCLLVPAGNANSTLLGNSPVLVYRKTAAPKKLKSVESGTGGGHSLSSAPARVTAALNGKLKSHVWKREESTTAVKPMDKDNSKTLEAEFEVV
ncbi:hypothetical protein CEUSTIGMA_g5597.t1 [Chlamydomonas eustigma]|uniref:RRM domain-containing protein n=1 Tax=Chlamydomonas eustigma TaxID=1157962 RepID=A0A250X4Z7_9CHLO|nr:hypothetical protein CEUSTIGMA_g5597.t1 [Chlamydomonas eustigma]|eukprot:GAX78155.1 hypothetical protein CEUSTIGMA_g5597.t1 [Chlamydomonas eustigma]